MAPTIHCKNTIYVHVLEMYPQSVICSSISLQENTRRTLDESIFRLLRASTKGRKVLTTVAFSSYMALFHLLSPLSVAALLNWTCPCCNAVLPLHWMKYRLQCTRRRYTLQFTMMKFPISMYLPCTYCVLFGKYFCSVSNAIESTTILLVNFWASKNYFYTIESFSIKLVTIDVINIAIPVKHSFDDSLEWILFLLIDYPDPRTRTLILG